MDNNPRAYTAPPKISRSDGKLPLAPMGAAVAAAAAALFWLASPRSAPPAPAPAAPAAPPRPAVAMPAARAEAKVEAKAEARAQARVEVPAEARPAARVETEAAFRSEGVPPSPPAPAKPAWANALTAQNWTWPRRVGIGNDGSISRKLISWLPANAAAKRLLYLMTVDREETRLYADEIPAYVERMMAQSEARRRQEEAEAEAEARKTQRQRDGQVAKVAPPPQLRAQPAVQNVHPALAAILAAAGGAAVGGAGGAIARQRVPYVEPPEVTAALKEIRARELEELRAGKKAAWVKDVTVAGGPRMAQLMYSNGRKEVVPYDPLVFDLKGTGVKTSSKKVLFDLFGFGKSEKTQWMSDVEEGTGILVFNASGSGASGKSGSEVFGDRTDLAGVGQPSGFVDGYEALRALVQKAVDEKVLAKEVLERDILDSAALAALDKAYGLKMKVGGFNRAPVSLAAAGVKEIALSRAPTECAVDFDGQLNDLVMQPGAVFLRADGTTGTYMNVWLTAKLGNLGLKTAAHLDP